MKKLLSVFMAFVVIAVTVAFSSVSAITYQPNVDVKTEAIALISLDTNRPIYQKNADKKMYPASTTKIMTYIIVVENVDDLENTKLKVTKKVIKSLEGTGSSIAGIEEGEEFTVLQLLNMMMIPSGNDAAAVLADYVGGGDEQKFVDKMNQKAQELGLTNTHFANSHGLHDDNHYTTANDMAVIAQYAMTKPYFTEITNKTSYEIPPTNKNDESRTVITTNKMLMSSEPEYFYTYAQGIKTGHTDEAGYCVVTTAVYEGMSCLCVALGAPSLDKDGNDLDKRQDMIDSANLYRWVFTTLELKTLADVDTPITEAKLKYVWGKNTIHLKPENKVIALLPMDVSNTSVMVDYDIPESLSAPLNQGDIVGTATYSYAGENIATVNLIVGEKADKNEVLAVIDVVWTVVSNPIFIICVSLFIVLIVVYIVFAVRYNRKKKAMRSQGKRYRK